MTRGRQRSLVPLAEASRYWIRLGFINFGGPAGQIAIMHDELVDQKRWIGNDRFLHALNYCMLLPGPEATQLAIYIGWLLNGTLGGIIAGVFFVLPAFFLILGLSWTYVTHGDIAWIAAVFYGLRAAVVGIVAAALVRLGSRALKNAVAVAIAAAAFVAIFMVKIPFPLIIVAAAAIGWLAGRLRPEAVVQPVHVHAEMVEEVLHDRAEVAERPTKLRMLKVLCAGLVAWWIPLFVVVGWRGWDDTLSELAVFFSQAAMVTFGGAYAVLSYIDQAAVQQFGWLQPGQMITGLGLAESTPGPLIMVTEFVGFLAAYRFPGSLSPLAAGLLGALVAVWATFAPCFLWIFLGAPYIERLRGNRSLDAALSGVTAAVVGVIANLAVTFATVALFSRIERGRFLSLTYPLPDLSSVDLFACTVVLVALAGLWRFRWNVLWVVTGSALAGIVYRVVL